MDIPKEALTIDKPDTSMLRFHAWEDAYYVDLSIKQPKPNMLTGNCLALDLNHGESFCYFLRKSPTEKNERPQTLVENLVKKFGGRENYIIKF